MKVNKTDFEVFEALAVDSHKEGTGTSGKTLSLDVAHIILVSVNLFTNSVEKICCQDITYHHLVL